MIKQEYNIVHCLNLWSRPERLEGFLKEAERTLKSGGKIVMIEPANSWFGLWIYKTFHHEPFDIKGGWEIQSTGPLSGSNQALPYIYFDF